MQKLWFFLFFFRRRGTPANQESLFTPEFWEFLEKFFIVMGVLSCALIIVGLAAYILRPISKEQQAEDKKYGEET